MNIIIILILIVLSVATLVLWIILVYRYLGEIQIQHKTKSTSNNSADMTHQAKLEAQAKMTAAVEKQALALQKALLTQSSAIEADFKKSITTVTTKQLDEFSKTLAMVSSDISQQTKAVVESSQSHSKLVQQSLATDTANTKAKVLKVIDDNIAEIMIGYLAEVAGDLDYYQQKDYLYSAIEANKDAIKKDINNAV